jgi:hypothetical protein
MGLSISVVNRFSLLGARTKITFKGEEAVKLWHNYDALLVYRVDSDWIIPIHAHRK